MEEILNICMDYNCKNCYGIGCHDCRSICIKKFNKVKDIKYDIEEITLKLIKMLLFFEQYDTFMEIYERAKDILYMISDEILNYIDYKTLKILSEKPDIMKYLPVNHEIIALRSDITKEEKIKMMELM